MVSFASIKQKRMKLVYRKVMRVLNEDLERLDRLKKMFEEICFIWFSGLLRKHFSSQRNTSRKLAWFPYPLCFADLKSLIKSKRVDRKAKIREAQMLLSPLDLGDIGSMDQMFNTIEAADTKTDPGEEIVKKYEKKVYPVASIQEVFNLKPKHFHFPVTVGYLPNISSADRKSIAVAASIRRFSFRKLTTKKVKELKNGGFVSGGGLLQDNGGFVSGEGLLQQGEASDN